jgi:hypothetical protein
MKSKNVGRWMLVGLAFLLVAAMFPSQAAALSCGDIGGTPSGDDCALNTTYVCTGATTIDITGDFTIGASGVIDCSGADGGAGTNGTNGGSGTDGASGTVGSPDGGAGTNGGNGTAGTSGGNATAANSITINAANVSVVGVINANGADGGTGGTGAQGGVGGSGGTGYVDGGNGGPAGNGGNGGAGGDAGLCSNGANITVNSSGLSISGSIFANGGDGGDGGDGGRGRVGGTGGSGGTSSGNGNIGGNGGVGGMGGDAAPGCSGGLIALNADFTVSGTISAEGGDGGTGGIGGNGGNGGNGGSGSAEGEPNTGGNGGDGGDGADGGDCANGGNGGSAAISSFDNVTITGTISTLAGAAGSGATGGTGGNAGAGGTGDPNGNAGTAGTAGSTGSDSCSAGTNGSNSITYCDTATLDTTGSTITPSASTSTDPDLCKDCRVEVTKEVALDDDCDGVADGTYGTAVTQDENECVVYRICVENTGNLVLNTSGVEIDDKVNGVDLGLDVINLGSIGIGNTTCIDVPSESPASTCTEDPDSCVCTEVEGTNTVEITAAVCDVTGANACDDPESICEDSATVDCLSCQVEIEKTVARDDDCDGTPDSTFENSQTQDVEECLIYQICVTNTGEQDLNTTGVQVSDTDLGIVDLDFGSIANGTDPVCKLIPTDAPAEACTADPDACVCTEVEGTNTAAITAAICTQTEADPCDDPDSICEDTANVDCLEVGACRMTGGHVAMAKVDSTFDDPTSGTHYSTGGQIGAPTENGCREYPQKGKCVDGFCTGGLRGGLECDVTDLDTTNDCPNDMGHNSSGPWGDWEHNHHSGPDDTGSVANGSFAFHSGTAAAPDEAYIQNVQCADPGWCVQARPAPFKQIFWEGYGVFHNTKGKKNMDIPLPDFSACGEDQPVPWSNKQDGTLHYYRAHVGDFGEPAGIRQKPADGCPQFNEFGGAEVNDCALEGDVALINGVVNDAVTALHPLCEAQDCAECPDWYEIEIHCTADPASPVAYRVAHHITEGNFQLHPAVGDSCQPCGDGLCQVEYDEDCYSCPEDCGYCDGP